MTIYSIETDGTFWLLVFCYEFLCYWKDFFHTTGYSLWPQRLVWGHLGICFFKLYLGFDSLQNSLGLGRNSYFSFFESWALYWSILKGFWPIIVLFHLKKVCFKDSTMQKIYKLLIFNIINMNGAMVKAWLQNFLF